MGFDWALEGLGVTSCFVVLSVTWPVRPIVDEPTAKLFSGNIIVDFNCSITYFQDTSFDSNSVAVGGSRNADDTFRGASSFIGLD